MLCGGFSLVAASGGYSAVAVHRLLLVVASLVAERELETLRLSSCSSQALEHRHTLLVALWRVGSSRTRDCTHVSCSGRWILYH